jgi:hypothetical protein
MNVLRAHIVSKHKKGTPKEGGVYHCTKHIAILEKTRRYRSFILFPNLDVAPQRTEDPE